MAIIIPAILEKEKAVFSGRAEEVERLPGVSLVQVDFADGKFVNNTTLSIEDMDVLNPALTWEAHLMVEEPVDFFDYQMVGFGTVIVHYEAFQDKSLILGSLAKINELGMKAGLAIKPNTSVDVVVQFKDLISQVTILSIEPGEQGREFLPESLEKIRQARLLLPEVQVEVDGGLNVDNIRAVVEAGADLLVVGSALVLSNNLQYSFDELTKAASFK
jgi:ribulose-phosphate 3-epimerase